MIITRENLQMFFAEAIKRTVTNERAFYGETFKKKLLVKEVVKNEH